MYDEFDDYFYPAEDNYHEDLLHEAEDFYNDFYGDEDSMHADDELENLLDELEYPFWRNPLPYKDLGRAGRAAADVTPLIPTTYDDSKKLPEKLQ